MQCDKLGCYSCKYSSRAGYGIFPEKNPAIEMVKMVGGRLPKGTILNGCNLYTSITLSYRCDKFSKINGEAAKGQEGWLWGCAGWSGPTSVKK